MFSMILRTQMGWTRVQVAFFTLLAFLAPALAWRLNAGAGTGRMSDVAEGLSMLLGPMAGLLALFGAFILAILPWTIDAETKHVYPLSLPISWPRYVGMRYLAGALTLLLPTVALYIGSLFALSMIELPPLLRAYPAAFAFRFLLAALVAYSASFALQHLAGRRAAIVALMLILSLGFLVVVMSLVGRASFGDAIGQFLFNWPGPLAVFTQSWVLIDV